MINIHSIINPIIKLLIIKLLFMNIVIKKYIIVTITDNILNLSLLLLFNKGLFFVSAGAYFIMIINTKK